MIEPTTVPDDVLAYAHARFRYWMVEDRHYVGCEFTAHDDANTIAALIAAMHTNPALQGLTSADYRWEGSASLSFAERAQAASFYAYCLS